jgi:hypothetical protein
MSFVSPFVLAIRAVVRYYVLMTRPDDPNMPKTPAEVGGKMRPATGHNTVAPYICSECEAPCSAFTLPCPRCGSLRVITRAVFDEVKAQGRGQTWGGVTVGMLRELIRSAMNEHGADSQRIAESVLSVLARRPKPVTIHESTDGVTWAPIAEALVLPGGTGEALRTAFCLVEDEPRPPVSGDGLSAWHRLGLNPVTFSVSEALAAHAATLGKPADELTESEQLDGFRLAALAATRERAAGDDLARVEACIQAIADRERGEP